MVEERHKALLRKRISDILNDVSEQEKTIEQEKLGLGIFYTTQFNKIRAIKDQIEKIASNFDSLCETNTYNEIDGTITTIRLELNF